MESCEKEYDTGDEEGGYLGGSGDSSGGVRLKVSTDDSSHESSYACSEPEPPEIPEVLWKMAVSFARSPSQEPEPNPRQAEASRIPELQRKRLFWSRNETSGWHDNDAWRLEGLRKTKVSTLLRAGATCHRSGNFMVDVRGPRASRCTINAKTTFDRGGRILATTGVAIHYSGSVTCANGIFAHFGSALGISDETPPFGIPACMTRLRRWDRPTDEGPFNQYAPVSLVEDHMDIDYMQLRRPFSLPPLENQAVHTSPSGILQDE